MNTYGVCTRNNPQGLATLLGSIISATHRRSPWHSEPYCVGNLVISDSSDSPILSDKHLSRLLPAFNLTYLRSQPGLVSQRLQILRAVGSGPVYFIDDDHVLVQDPNDAFEAANKTSTLTALFGASTDLHNDRGYPDYRLWSNDPTTTHSLHLDPSAESVVAPDLEEYSANAGNMLIVSVERVIRLYSVAAAQLSKHPSNLESGSMDDRLARMIATTSHLHHSLDALHIGNSNNWWATSGADKAKLTSDTAVIKLLVEAMQ